MTKVQILELVVGIVFAVAWIYQVTHKPAWAQREPELAGRDIVVAFLGSITFLGAFVLDYFYNIHILGPR